MNSPADTHFLQRLASYYGILTTYNDVSGERHDASPEAMMAVLRSLGAPVVSSGDVPEAWRLTQQEYWRIVLEPVIIAWEGQLAFNIRMNTALANAGLKYTITLETGEKSEGYGGTGSMFQRVVIEGVSHTEKRYSLPETLPFGYHTLEVEMGGVTAKSLVICAPLKAWMPDDEDDCRRWGVFLPLYSLHTENSWGGGDFSDMEALLGWVGGIGGHMLGTLPLLSAFLKDKPQVSPYLPVSRMMWNEFYLDIESIPELQHSHVASEMIFSPGFQQELGRLKTAPLIDYGAQMKLKRRVLEELCRCLHTTDNRRSKELQRFISDNKVIDDYARFMAACEKNRDSWQTWPEQLRNGNLRDDDYADEDRLYYTYTQWLASEQMDRITGKARSGNVKLYLDLPVGIHPDGYDSWRYRNLFASGVSVGAPPDTVFTGGQNWGFPPPHPQEIRKQGYAYTISYLRHHLKHAGVLRIDHGMGLHRLFCIPEGMGTENGLYLGYRSDEMYAIITLESHRNKSVIVEEDLGTVPSYVRPAMKRHGLQRMYVMQYELAGGLDNGPNPVPPDSLASLNTHDMPPFAAYWHGMDIPLRQQLGLLHAEAANEEQKRLALIKSNLSRILKEKGWLSGDEIKDVISACYTLLADSPACMMMINLEDLWQETLPQNVPSTSVELPNWQRRLKLSFEEFSRLRDVLDVLSRVNDIRKQGVDDSA